MEHEVGLPVAIHILDMALTMCFLRLTWAEPHAQGVDRRGTEALRRQNRHGDDPLYL